MEALKEELQMRLLSISKIYKLSAIIFCELELLRCMKLRLKGFKVKSFTPQLQICITGLRSQLRTDISRYFLEEP